MFNYTNNSKNERRLINFFRNTLQEFEPGDAGSMYIYELQINTLIRHRLIRPCEQSTLGRLLNPKWQPTKEGFHNIIIYKESHRK